MLRKKLSPPIAPKKPKVIEIHGRKLEDPYFWLRDKDNEEVINYLKAENEYTEAFMKDTEAFQEQLYLELKGRIKETDMSVPVQIDDYFYYVRTVEGLNYAIHCRRKGSMESPEEVIFDENEYAEGHEYFRLGALKISPDHKLMAYSIDTNGYETYDLFIKDIETGKILTEINEVAGAIEWDNNGKAIFYTILDDIHRSYALKFHELGKAVEEDQLIYEEADKEYFVVFGKSRSKGYLMVSSISSDTTETWFAPLVPKGDAGFGLQSALTVFAPRTEGVEYSITHHEDNFYIVTNEDAINFKIMKCPINNIDRSNWTEFIPHDPAVRIVGIDAFKDFLAIFKREGGFMAISIFDVGKGEFHDIELPEQIYALGSGSNPNYETKYYRFRFSSPITPPITYDYDISEQKLIVRKQEEVKGFDPSKFVTKRDYATAEDGTQIPISIAYRKDVPLDGSAPALLYGYGSYGYSIDPGFNSPILSFLERGMVYAIAHIRGGGEMGKPWYLEGKLKKKKNTFTDFIAVAEHLIKKKYTSPDRLAIMGGSAGGLLMGAVVNMRPDLFKVVVARVPFVDVVNTMLDETIPLTTFEYKEWGNPNDPEYFEYILSYSPYDNVEPKEYPAMLITAGLNDPRVHYWEPAKWTAKLRATKTDSNPLLLKTNMGAGHAGASGRYDYLKELAFVYTFIFKMLGLISEQGS
ncbi:MAG: S9 family peptidase [Methanobacteriota archaeon]|nr:MAG: S9 family peptidase [Euryarchaeota archaeon]